MDTELENERAQRFYYRQGFEETFRIVQFRMELKEIPPPGANFYSQTKAPCESIDSQGAFVCQKAIARINPVALAHEGAVFP